MKTTLYYKNGGSDKVYTATVDGNEADGFTVNYQYGRRGSTLTTGTKTSSPVALDAATKIFDKLIAEKTAKGYSPGEDSTPYQNTAKAGQVSGLLPHLLNSIDEQEAARLVDDPQWLMQQKFDGRRLILRKAGDLVEGINKLGLVINVAEPIAAAARKYGEDFILDGEVIGDDYYAFDLLSVNATDIRDAACIYRVCELGSTLLALRQNSIHLVPTWITSEDKADALKDLGDANAEGAVFKRTDSVYKAGRPASGGSQRKHKFYATLSAVVAQVNAKRSIAVSLLDGDDWLYVGDCAIPPNKTIPTVGDVVEIRYLYATDGRRIYQPVYLGVRDDVLPAECLIGQMKFKGGNQ